MSDKSCGCTGRKTARMYNSSTQDYSRQTSVVPDKLCNGVTVINKGNTIALWNGLPLVPGESMTVGGNEGEVYIGRIDISFALPVPAPPVPINQAFVIQKFYVGENFV